MKEYIDKDAARDLMEQALVDEWEIQYADDRLDEIPAADVPPALWTDAPIVGTEFMTHSQGQGGFEIHFRTDSREKYGAVQEECRRQIDHTKPAADVVEVVRCKDCKWWCGAIYGNRCFYHSGPKHTEFYDAEEFCSRGERKGGNTDG